MSFQITKVSVHTITVKCSSLIFKLKWAHMCLFYITGQSISGSGKLLGLVGVNWSHLVNENYLQYNFSGLNTDGSFTMAVLNSFLSPLEKSNFRLK